VQRVKADGTQMMPQTLPAGPQVLDEAVLLRLISLAGPGDAPELMRRLQADLRDVAAGLTAGLAGPDAVALRRHSHILMGIAGTLGAHHIHYLAQLLNQLAQAANGSALAPLAADLLQRLQVLILRLQGMAFELGLGR
jgi:HPt (histidine-containing phosphotransfer) domain-containing protein